MKQKWLVTTRGGRRIELRVQRRTAKVGDETVVFGEAETQLQDTSEAVLRRLKYLDAVVLKQERYKLLEFIEAISYALGPGAIEPIKTFEDAVQSIRRAYHRIGHKQGWRFLYGPKRTFSRNTRIFLIGLNPGGRHYQRGLASVEAGNAYRGVELWHWGERQNALQSQVCLFAEELARRLHCNRDELMDEMLVSNFCPFRSPRIEEMKPKLRAQSFAYSRRLWSNIFDVVLPLAIVCIGFAPHDEFCRILEDKGFRADTRRYSAGWGVVSYKLTQLTSNDRRILLVGLPHLSTFKIFGREGTNSTLVPLWRAMLRILK